MSASADYLAAWALYKANEDWYLTDPPDLNKGRGLITACHSLLKFPERSSHGGSEEFENNHGEHRRTIERVQSALAAAAGTSASAPQNFSAGGAVLFDTSDWNG